MRPIAVLPFLLLASCVGKSELPPIGACYGDCGTKAGGGIGTGSGTGPDDDPTIVDDPAVLDGTLVRLDTPDFRTGALYTTPGYACTTNTQAEFPSGPTGEFEVPIGFAGAEQWMIARPDTTLAERWTFSLQPLSPTEHVTLPIVSRSVIEGALQPLGYDSSAPVLVVLVEDASGAPAEGIDVQAGGAPVAYSTGSGFQPGTGTGPDGLALAYDVPPGASATVTAGGASAIVPILPVGATIVVLRL